MLVQKIYRGAFTALQIVAMNAMPSTAVCFAEPVEGINKVSLAAVKSAVWQV